MDTPGAGAYARAMLTGFAHAAVCVVDVQEATRWYSEVLGLEILSPPFELAGEAIERDMGELVPSPVVVKAAILGLGADDHVLELIEYPRAAVPAVQHARSDITQLGLTHVGLVCDDIERTRGDLQRRGVRFLTSGIANVAALRTTWFNDPWGNTFILIEKRHGGRAYWNQSRA
jgi:catechol 2,3-dioxygenase-like lactoylglutathione lyase family enzyme